VKAPAKVTLRPRIRGAEHMSPEQLLAELEPRAAMTAGHDGLWDMEEPELPEVLDRLGLAPDAPGHRKHAVVAEHWGELHPPEREVLAAAGLGPS
jgi:hypothetical protein